MASIVKTSTISDTYPLDKAVYITGTVVKGFGRGRELLGIPTANLPAESYTAELENIENGVYIGWASVNNGPTYKAVLSIGDNPHFKNKSRTIEPYLVHQFEGEFYGAQLKLIIVGFIRDMKQKFANLEELKTAILNDVAVGSAALDHSPYKQHETDNFFNAIAKDNLLGLPYWKGNRRMRGKK